MIERNSIVGSVKSEHQVIAIFDIGGTNTRVQLTQKNNFSANNLLEKDIFKLRISSKIN